jgi:type IV pilus assembly protein PilO
MLKNLISRGESDMDLESLPWYGQFLVFLLIGIVILGLFYYIHYSPKQDDISKIEKQIDEIEIEIKKAERKKNKLAQMEEQLENTKEFLEKLKGILPEKEEISQILKNIQSNISNTRLKIYTFSPRPEKVSEVYIEKPYSIQVEGNYHNLGIFFDQLSRLKKIFTINSLNINSTKKSSSEFTVKANFVAATYLYRKGKDNRKTRKR